MTTKTATVIQPKRAISTDLIEATVHQVVEKFQPQQVILFGSYAYGTPRPESDLDLLVIMDTPLKEVEQAIQICQSIQYHFPLDLLVRTPAKLRDRIKLGDPFLTEIVQRGKIVYERPGA